MSTNFALLHIKGFEFWTLVDALVGVSVIAIAFTYAAHKTGVLVVGIVFHFLHDAFLYITFQNSAIVRGTR